MNGIYKKMRGRGRTSLYILIILILTVPSLAITRYTYPCQDDFHYAFYARETMAEGHGLLYTALSWTVQYYKTFCGCYTSTFLGYFFSGAINCNLWGIRIFEFCSLLLFYGALYVFLYAVAYKLMGLPSKKVLPLYSILLAMFNGLIYYVWHEAFYWFITSVQYLMITSIILLGIAAFSFAMCEEPGRKRTLLLTLAAVLGFLGSGGTLSIAAFCCSLYFLVTMWGMADRGQFKSSGVVMGVTLLGAIINGVSPGNYQRAGTAKTMKDIIYAGIMSVKYMIERWETFVKNPVFWMIMILLFLVVFSSGRQQSRFKFKLPGIFILVLFGFVSGIIFPAMLGYGYDVYEILMRGNFISDTAFYLYIFIGMFYVKGWFDEKYEGASQKIINKDTIGIACFFMAALLVHERQDWQEIPFISEYRDLSEGVFAEYSDFCVNVYRQIEESEGDTAEVHTDFVEQHVCLIGPQFVEGWYDPDKEYANRTIARFYGKRAVYIYYN